MVERWRLCCECTETHGPPMLASIVEGGRVAACDACGSNGDVTVFRIKDGF